MAVRSVTYRTLTYGDLPLSFRAIQDWLLERGVGAGDQVGIAMSNGPDLAIALLGAAMHATVTPLDPAQVPLEWSAVLRHVGAKALIDRPDARTSGTFCRTFAIDPGACHPLPSRRPVGSFGRSDLAERGGNITS